MRHRNHIYALLIPVITVITLFCPGNASCKIKLKTIDLGGEIPSTSVRRVFQDTDGLIWLGTPDGLYRFDGYKTLVFRSNYNNNILPNNDITYITEDKNNNLLVGTHKGISVLNKKTYIFRTLEHKSVHDKTILFIKVSSDNIIWIGTIQGLYSFNPDFTFRKEYSGIAHVDDIYEDLYGNLWFCIAGTGIHKYDKTTDSLIPFPPVGKANYPFRVFQDNRKQYWVCTWGDGLYLFDPNKNPETMYQSIPVRKKGTQELENFFFSIVQDDFDGNIWTVSISGVNIFEYTDNSTIKEVENFNILESTNGIFSEIVNDRDGNLWIGAYNEGALLLSFDRTNIENLDLTEIKKKFGISPNIRMIYEDNDGLLWFNQNRYGLCVYNPLDKRLKFFENLPSSDNHSQIRLADYIPAMTEIPGSKKMWFAFGYGSQIYEVDKDYDAIRLSNIIDLNAISNETGGIVACFFIDNKNNVWIGTHLGLLVKPYNSNAIRPVNQSMGNVTGITEDSQGSIWISTNTQGLFRITLTYNTDWENLNIKKYPENESAFPKSDYQTIAADNEGRVWIGTIDGEVFMYNTVTQRFTDYTHCCGKKGSAILNIITDASGYIWIVTTSGIIQYNPSNETVWVYTSSGDVQINSFIRNAVARSKQANCIFFGGNMGITAIGAPTELLNFSTNPTPIVTDVKIQNRSLLLSHNNEQFDFPGNTLVLNPGDNSIEFDFSSLNYAFPEKVQYAYMLSGVDKEWITANTNRQFASYNQLKKGKYTFHLKATDENKIWGKDEYTLVIYKDPAFYESWWAYFIYSVLFIALILFVFKFIYNRIKLKNQLRIAEVEREKTEELAQTKLRYFTNISHDFLTPLTIISCTIDDIETTSGKELVQLETMRSSVNRLRRLLQQILDFRKIENNSIYLRVSYGDIALFIKDICYTHFAPLIKKKNINFQFVSDPVRNPAFFDADKIEKILYNIMSNALKYTPDGGDIGIEMKNMVKGSHIYVSISIRDTGIGIDESDLENIFTRFYFNKRNSNDETNGIGLSLTKDLVELHHGNIYVDSKVSSGSTFTVELPIEESAYLPVELANAAQNLTGESSIPSDEDFKVGTDESGQEDQTTLLLVEDNDELLKTIRNILSRNYNVVTAHNGVEALRELERTNVDIIVSDVMMPEMDGLELCRTLKANFESSHIPILMLTAKNSVDDRIACYNAGADGYISKPFELKVLEARINNFILSKRKNQKAFKEDLTINISRLQYASQDETFLIEIVEMVEKHISETEFDNIAFAQSMNMSKSSLYRKIKTMTGLSPAEFIKNIRLKHACMLLENESVSIAEVAYLVGFTEPKYFSNCFRQEFGISPKEYRMRSKNNG